MTSLYPAPVTRADESYRSTVTLNERDGTFDYNDFRESSNWKGGFTGDGFKLGGEMEWHSGKRVEKSWSFQFGGLNRSSSGGNDPEVGIDPVVYPFETSRITDTLRMAPVSRLESQGTHGQAVQPPMNQASRLAFTAEYIYAMFYV